MTNVIAKPTKGVVSRAHRPAKTGANKAIEAGESVPAIGRDVLVPLDRLFISDANVRKARNVHEDVGIVELAALIESQGLLQRLSVVAQDDERFAVVAGGRRLRAMQMLVETGKWSASQPVECKLYDEAQAIQVSLAENSARSGLHPADQMEAFRQLIDDGLSVAQVASRFGVSVLTVERRLKLARLAPRFLDLYRADEIESDQLQALSIIDDPARQEAVWDGLSTYDRSAWRIRNAVTGEACSADSRLALFVGLDAYEAEGGSVRRDLFASMDDLSGIFLDNPELLQRLALEKLRGHAAVVKDEGWLWTECSLDADASAWRRHGHEHQGEREPTPEESEAIQQIEAEHRRLADAYDKHQDEGDRDAEDFDLMEQQLCEALEAIEDKRDTACMARRQWIPEQLARAGAVVRLDSHGEVVIDRGLIRSEDRKGSTTQATRAGVQDGRDDESAPRDASATSRPEFSEKLMRDLTAHRTAAIQASLAQKPNVALVVLVHRMAETVFGLYGSGDDVVKVSVRIAGDSTLAQEASEYATSPAASILGSAETQWGDRLPGDPGALFRWLLAQPTETLLELLAYCTARSFNAIRSRARSFDQSDAVAQALDVDLANWWSPSPERYLNSVSKAKALEAVKEATGVDLSTTLGGMKKSDLVAHCAAKLEGTRWLPTPLRAKTAGDISEHEDPDPSEA